MSLGNGNPKEGDKGSNFNYELKVLQGLEAIAIALENQTPTKSEIIYEAMVSLNNDFTFTVVEITNTTGYTAGWSRWSQGQYFLNFTNGLDIKGFDATTAFSLFNSGLPPFSKLAQVTTNINFIEVATYDSAAAPQDYLENFYIRVKFLE